MSGEWKPGFRIPYEHELMQTYGCARMTVNKALAALAAAGLIDRRKRAGSFVAAPRYNRAVLAISDMREEIRGQGRRYDLELALRAVRDANDEDRALLGPNGRRVLSLDCRHLADGAPYALEHRLINLGAVPEAEAVDFSVEPPGSWLLEHVPWTEARHRITAINAAPDIAARLGLDPGDACLSLERWTRRGEAPITYVRQLYPGFSYGLMAEFSGA